jgi:hypothetical protein
MEAMGRKIEKTTGQGISPMPREKGCFCKKNTVQAPKIFNNYLSIGGSLQKLRVKDKAAMIIFSARPI